MEILSQINKTAGFRSPLDSISESRNTPGSSFNILVLQPFSCPTLFPNQIPTKTNQSLAHQRTVKRLFKHLLLTYYFYSFGFL